MKFAVVLAFALLAVASADVWSNCGTSADHLKDLTVKLTPDPPVKGQALDIAASGTFDEQLTAMTLNYNVEGLISGSLNLCNLLAKTQFPCPIAKGPLSVNKSFNIPSWVPSGIPFSAQVTVTEQHNQQVACIKINIEF